MTGWPAYYPPPDMLGDQAAGPSAQPGAYGGYQQLNSYAQGGYAGGQSAASGAAPWMHYAAQAQPAFEGQGAAAAAGSEVRLARSSAAANWRCLRGEAGRLTA